MKSAPHLSLKICEGLPRDMGRAFGRLDPADLTALDLATGDIIAVTGNKTSYCRAMPTHSEIRGQKKIQLDGISRSNIEAGLDQTVDVAKSSCRPALSIKLAPLNSSPGKSDESYIASQLDGLPVINDDKVRIMLFNSRPVDFKVKETAPSGPVLIMPETELTIEKRVSDSPPDITIPSYEEIGGLSGQLSRIREMIELPLKFPRIFDQLGISPPKGVLLHGPPGCGKTLIARTIAHEADATFYAVNGPEIVHKFYGESEAHLRQIFDKASKNDSAIIFLDEIDAIAPRREKAAGDVERRIVAQLLALMDGLDQRPNLVVIAATNIPNAIDPALRRPGRFDREIIIPVPDRTGRKEILEIHSRGMPLGTDVSLSELADITHGFVGADLTALCREAAMNCLRSFLPHLDYATSHIPYEKLAELTVSREDFLHGMGEIEPSAIRELFVEIPNVRWDDIGGLDIAKTRLIESVEWPLLYPDIFARAGARPAKGILLTGPPGCGKTLLARAIATESRVNFISVKGPALLSKYVGEAEEAVRDVFKKARQAAPCVLFFDEIDALAPSRSGTGTNQVGERVLTQLLTEIDGIEGLYNVLVLAATNRVDILDEAILRPGRFDEVISLDIPNPLDREAVFRVHLKNKPVSGKVDLHNLAELTDNFSAADIAASCNQAAMAAVRRAVKMVGEEPEMAEKTKITVADITSAIDTISVDKSGRG